MISWHMITGQESADLQVTAWEILIGYNNISEGDRAREKYYREQKSVILDVNDCVALCSIV